MKNATEMAHKKKPRVAKATASQPKSHRTPSTLSSSGKKALSKVEHIRSELASLYRQTRIGNVSAADASRFTYMLATLARIIEGSDLEKQLEELQGRLDRIEGTK